MNMKISITRDLGKKLSWIFLVLLSLLAGFAFINSPGTNDVQIWSHWMDTARTNGLVAGFSAVTEDYPPLAITIMFLANQILRILHIEDFLSIKLSILFFLLFTTTLFWFWTRNLKVTIILYFALFLNSVLLGYIDIYFTPGLLLSLWMLKERRWLWFSIAFTLTCLTKYQPLMIAPFLFLYLLDIQDVRQWMRIKWKLIFLQIMLPAMALMGLTLVVFGLQPVWMSFSSAIFHKFLSGLAFNIPWIITHFLHVFSPDQFGGLNNGLADPFLTDSLRITLLPKLLFWISYLLALVQFFRSKKNFTNLLIYSMIGYFCYFIFNTGVHENHLFLVAILGMVLFWLEEGWRVNVVILLVIFNINMFLFYGAFGDFLPFLRLIAGIDSALILAILNVLFFIYLYILVMTENHQLERSGHNQLSSFLS
jgi:hypothetical protein